MADISTSTTVSAVSGSRNTVFSQLPVSEEDESTETGSEGAEPLTPVTDSAPHQFHHQDSGIGQTVALPTKPMPDAAKTLQDVSQPPLHHSPPQISNEPSQGRMQGQDGDKQDRVVSSDVATLPILSLQPTLPPQAANSSNSDPTAENPAPRITTSTTPSQPSTSSQTQNGISGAVNKPKTSKTELPSLYDVPAGRRKSSPARGRQESQTSKADSKDGSTSTTERPRRSSPEKPAPHIQKAPTTPVSSEPPKRNIVQRANTFLSRLKRTPSSRADDTMLAPAISHFDASKPTPAVSRKPSIPISQSARNTPSTSTSHTPPSPGSISSTISEDREDDDLKKITTTGGHHYSRSHGGISAMGQPRQGITWGNPNFGPSLRRPSPETLRKRSASTDHIPKLGSIRKPNEPVDPETPMPVQLFPTFSKHANEGAGLKARRLSTSLPDEFYVDYCELNKEFKASKFFARRGKTIGKGATADVTIMARRDVKDSLVAVKEFRGKENDESEDEYVKKVKSEYTIAASLHHPNIVQTVRLCTHGKNWNHVMEYCDIGDIYSLVDKKYFSMRGGHYKYEDKMCLWKQLLRGVDYLHSHGIAHRDIKLENLLMTKEGVVKITDFGVSEVFCGEHPGLRAAGGECGKNMGEVRKCQPGICGSLPYIAPEVLAKKGEYDPRPLDVWSCAIVYITMHVGGPPWHAAKPDQANYKRFIDGWDKWSKDHPDGEIKTEEGGWPKCGPLFALLDPPGLRRLLLKMLNPDPEKRVTIRDVLSKSFIKSFACCTPETLDEDGACCGGVDALKGTIAKSVKKGVLPKHNHLPPKEHKTPKAFQHRFDMGDGWT